MSNSNSRLILDYFRTRFPVWLVLSLPLVIVLPAVVSGSITSASELVVISGMALLLFVEFRLWDDLSDREQDCREDPSRVLCQANSIRPFMALLLVLCVVNFALAIWRGPWQSAVILLALHCFLAIWYAVRQKLQVGPIANYHAVLLKYPVCGLQLAYGVPGPETLLLSASLAVVYLALCIVEVLHDPRLRARRSAWICLGVELVLLAGIIVVAFARVLLFENGEGNSWL